jgi:hypothetical protein
MEKNGIPKVDGMRIGWVQKGLQAIRQPDPVWLATSQGTGSGQGRGGDKGPAVRLVGFCAKRRRRKEELLSNGGPETCKERGGCSAVVRIVG